MDSNDKELGLAMSEAIEEIERFYDGFKLRDFTVRERRELRDMPLTTVAEINHWRDSWVGLLKVKRFYKLTE